MMEETIIVQLHGILTVRIILMILYVELKQHLMKQLLKIVFIQLSLNLDIIQKYLNINMNKKGLRGFIRNRLPKTWEIVLTRERKLTAFIEYVYESTPSVMKGGRGWRHGVHNITVGYNRCKIYEMFQAEKSKEGLIYWVGIYNKIKDLEHQMN